MTRLSRCIVPFVILLLASAVQAQTPLKIGVFDPQRVSEETIEGKRVQAELEAVRQRKQDQIAGEERQIGELQNQLQTQALSLSMDRRSAMELEIQRRLLALENAKDLASKQLQLELAGAQARFNDKLLVVIETFGREESFDVILDRSLVAFASEPMDLTTAIIDRYDGMFPAQTEKPEGE